MCKGWMGFSCLMHTLRQIAGLHLGRVQTTRWIVFENIVFEKNFNMQTKIDDINYASVHAFSIVIDFTPKFVHRSSPLQFS
jgi:hypothetical protein